MFLITEKGSFRPSTQNFIFDKTRSETVTLLDLYEYLQNMETDELENINIDRNLKIGTDF